MSKRDEFVDFINALKAVSPSITDQQRKGLLKQAMKEYGLLPDEAAQILKDSGIVVGELINYFEVLGFSIDEFEGLSEITIAQKVDDAYGKLYPASLSAGGRRRPDGRTEEQWRAVLIQARDILKDSSKRSEHIAALEQESALIEEPITTPPIGVLNPFRFRNGEQATTLQELVTQIDENWTDGKYHLYSGDIANWLGAIGRADFATTARNLVASEKDEDIGLEKFLQSLGPDAPPSPKLEVDRAKLNFGRVNVERIPKGKYTTTFRITNASRGHLYGTVRCSASWLQLSATHFRGNSVTITVEAVTLGRKAEIIIRSNGGTCKIPVEMNPVHPWHKPVLKLGGMFTAGFVTFRLIMAIAGGAGALDRAVMSFFLFIRGDFPGKAIPCWGIVGLLIGATVGFLLWLRKVRRPRLYPAAVTSFAGVLFILWGIGSLTFKVPVQIEAYPNGAMVYIDNEPYPQLNQASTPIWLKPGTYEIKVTANGYLPETRTLKVKRSEGEVLKIRLKESPGSLSITCENPRRAQITVYEPSSEKILRQAGNVPSLTLDELKPGIYTVEAKANGYQSVTQSVQIKPGEESDVKMSLRKLIGTLKVDCPNVPVASVYLNNERRRRGTTPLTISNLPPGTYTVRVSGGGYTTIRKVAIQAFKTTRISVLLGEGRVTKVVGKRIEVDLGRRDGIVIGSQLRVLLQRKPVRDTDGNLLGFEELRYVVTSVQEAKCKAEPIGKSAEAPEIRDKVKIIKQ